MEKLYSLLPTLIEKPKVLVVGLGVTGLQVALFFASNGVEVVVVERQSEEKFIRTAYGPAALGQIAQADYRKKIAVHFGIDGQAVCRFLTDVGAAILSPGVKLDGELCNCVKQLGIAIFSELELGLTLSNLKSIVVTGSNGKSSTVSLITHILSQSGKRPFLCGNIGIPILSKMAEIESGAFDSLVVEASSYQLELCSALRAAVGVVLNISENHLERHGSIEAYAAAKEQVFSGENSSQVAVLNYDDPMVRAMGSRRKGVVFYFGNLGPQKKLAPEAVGAWVRYQPHLGIDELVFQLPSNRKDFRISQETVSLKGLPLLGLHNRLNVAAAILSVIALEMGRGVGLSQLVESTKSFVGLEHRLEVVNTAQKQGFDKGLTWVNDSKSTTVASVVAALRTALESYPESKIILLVGGLAKVGSWEPLRGEIVASGARIGLVICFGKDGAKIAASLKAGSQREEALEVVPRVEEAVFRAREVSKSGDLVLFSPGCASFDHFADFEERGRVFKSIVNEPCNSGPDAS